MKKLSFALLVSLLVIASTRSMERENSELDYVELHDIENPVQNNEESEEIDGVNTIYGGNVIFAQLGDEMQSSTCSQKALEFLNTHKHKVHATLSGALSLSSIWLLGQDNPMASMIFLNGFSYNLGRMLPKNSNKQLLRYALPAVITAALYGVDVALGNANVDTNWAFGLIGASIAQVCWTKRLHKTKPKVNEELNGVDIQ